MAAGLEASEVNSAAASVSEWLESKVQGVNRYRVLVQELRQLPGADLAMLTVAVRTLAGLVPPAGGPNA
jgi:NAD-specific glutamate dehydrogenase